jgi:hypothetical protein
MRLFITSYQKSGTHQIMPMLGVADDIVDRGHNSYINAPKRYGLNREINWPGVEETAHNLRLFPSKAFGHVAYMPEYAQVFEETDTRVIFNVRDPRDVVVAEYENALKKLSADPKVPPLWNFYDEEAGMRIFEKPDPISDLIILAAARWPHWTGWMKHSFVMTVKYEDIRLNTFETAKKIYKWLEPVGCEIPEVLAQKAKPKPGNPTFRKGVPGEWKEKFELHHMELAEELLGDVIKELGYEW